MKLGSSRMKAGQQAVRRAPIALVALATGALMIGIVLLSPRPVVGPGKRPGIAPIGAAREPAPSHRGDVVS